MQYREIAGMNASVIGFGGEHLDRKPYEQVEKTVGAMLDAGINIMDVFMPGKEIRSNLHKALKGRRKDVILQGHIGSVDINQQYEISRHMPDVERYFEELLRAFETDYIDLGMMFFIDSEKDFNGVFHTPFIKYVENLKRDGKIRAIGFSSHNPVIAKQVIETGVPQAMLFSINPAFDMLPVSEYALEALDKLGLENATYGGIDPTRAELYTLCQARGVGITVMKTFGAGKLLSAEHTPFAKPLTPVQCIHYALTRPAVASVLLGCQSPEEIEKACAYLTASDEEKDYTGISIGRDFTGQCVYCGHCQPCPAGIDIASVHKYLDIARLSPETPDTLRRHYESLSAGGADCTGCGSCESRCPFGVTIQQNMAEAHRRFG